MSKQTKSAEPTAGTDAPAKRERKASPPPDIFSAGRSISMKLSPFPLDEQVQTLRFVLGVIESKQKAEVEARLAKAGPFHASPPARTSSDLDAMDAE